MSNGYSEDDRTESFTILAKGTEISHYRIIEKIGAGGMGEVYLAEDTELNRKVALKFLPQHLCQDDDCRARFKREAQATAALKHPNIVTIHEVSEYNKQPFFAMELIEGQSLHDVIKGKEIPLKSIIDLVIQVCQGLEKAHEAGIVHRDIKPSNILMDSDDRPKVLDFGLATIKGGEKLTKTGSTLGTAGHMSPEQVRGEEVDQRSDIFSLGVVIYELVTSKSPFKEEYDAATMNSILHDTPEPLKRYKSDVPDSLQLIVDKALDKDKETRYQTAAGMLADLRRLKKELEPSESYQKLEIPKKKYVKILYPSFVAIIILLVLLIKPWKFEISPRQEAIAQENKLAIMYFDNLADPTDRLKLGEITANLLITDLSESGYIQVVSSQRLYDILKQLGREREKKIDRNIATKVAQKAKARWMLLGNVLKTEPNIILTAQLVEVESGNVKASQRIEGDQGEDIFALVDKLTIEIKRDLSLPEAAMAEADKPIIDVTTSSIKAYRYYLEGIENRDKFYYDEAEESFRKAIEHDSTFAMAYYALASNVTFDEAKTLIPKAVKYSEKASKIERFYINMAEKVLSESITIPELIKQYEKYLEQYPEEKLILKMLADYYGNENQYEKAIDYYRVLELDPFYKQVYNSLAYLYEEIDDVDKSIWAINKYIELAPDEANPYDSRGDLYAFSGKVDEAIESYKNALELKSDFLDTRDRLGFMYLFKQNYAEASGSFQQLLSSNSEYTRSMGRGYMALIPLYQGKFEKAVEILNDGIAADRIEQYEGWPHGFKFALKAFIYYQIQSIDSAMENIEKAMSIQHKADTGDVLYWRDNYIMLLAINSEFDNANEVLLTMKQDIDERAQYVIYGYWWAAGHIAMAKGEPKTAADNFEKAINTSKYEEFVFNYDLASAYLESDRIGDAVEILEKTALRYDEARVRYPIRSVKVYYLLGLAYEKSGWIKKAIRHYEIFLNIWKNADPGIVDIEDAKKRLVRLKSRD